jgi:hypothetical protein
MLSLHLVVNLQDLLWEPVSFVNNRAIWQRIAHIPMEHNLEAIMQKEEGPRGMAKEDRLCSMLTVIYHQLSCF